MSTEDREDTCRIQRDQLLPLLDLTTAQPPAPPARQLRKRMPTIELAIDRATPLVDTTSIDRMLDAAISREIDASLVDVEVDNAFESITTIRRRTVNNTVDIGPAQLLIALAVCFVLGFGMMFLLG